VASRIPKDITVVSESGITTRADIDLLAKYGVHAFLVGETLMRAQNPAETLRGLLTQ
jgi:indole-3-glycerol phosphate synthase